MEKRNKIREWEAERDDLSNKLGLCEEKLRKQKQDQKLDDFNERLATTKVRDKCLKTSFFVIFGMWKVIQTGLWFR